MFLIPVLASVILLGVAWWGGVLRRPYLVAGSVAVGLGAQLLAPGFSPLWVAGLLLNVANAIFLSIVVKLNW